MNLNSYAALFFFEISEFFYHPRQQNFILKLMRVHLSCSLFKFSSRTKPY